MIGEIAFYGKVVDIDSQYYNADGDHIYYERSLIEKKQFMRKFPISPISKNSVGFWPTEISIYHS